MSLAACRRPFSTLIGLRDHSFPFASQNLYKGVSGGGLVRSGAPSELIWLQRGFARERTFQHIIIALKISKLNNSSRTNWELGHHKFFNPTFLHAIAHGNGNNLRSQKHYSTSSEYTNAYSKRVSGWLERERERERERIAKTQY